jgi:hypothetical protein
VIRRAKGHVASAPDFHPSRPALPDGVIGLGTALPESASLQPFMTAIRDQGDAEACEGFAWARAIQLRAAAQDAPVPYPSEYAIWTLARGNAEGMQNEGVSTQAVVAALAQWGVVAEQRLPFPRDYTERLPLDVFQHGADARLLGVYGVRGRGQPRVLQMRQALAAGYPVPFAMPVDQAYEANPGDIYTGLQGPIQGYHMQVTIAYAPRPGGGYKFLVPGSWGRGWAQAGYVWIADTFMGSSDVSDVYAVDAAPRGVS